MIKILSLAVLTAFLSTMLPAQDSEAKAADTALSKMLDKAKLQVVDGKAFKDTKMEKTPEFYILYFSASW